MSDAISPIADHPPAPQDDPGGSGGTAPVRAIRTTRLIRRALAERWPIPAGARAEILDRLMTIVSDPDASPRERTSAAKAIMSASSINLAGVTAAIAASNHEDVLSRLAELEDAVREQTQDNPS